MMNRLARAVVTGISALFAVGLAGCKVDQAKEVATYRRILDQDSPPVDYAPGQPLTLEKALALANYHNETLGLRGEDYFQALIAKDRAAAAFMPTISINPGYSVSQQLHGQSNSVAIPSPSGKSKGGGENHHIDIPAEGRMNLFNGFIDLNNYRAAGRTIEERRALLLDAQATVLLDVAQVYYSVLTSERNVEVLKNSLKVQEEHLRDARSKLQAGLGKQLDVAQSEAQASATRVTLIQAQSNVITGRSTLSNLIGARITADAPLVDDAQFTTDLAPLDELERIAEASRQDLIAAEALVQARVYEVEAAVGEYYPSVTFNATYFLEKESSPTQAKWSAGLSANIPIFTGGIIQADVRQAWSFLRQAKMNESATRRQIIADVEITHENVRASLERLRELQIQLSSAEEALRQADQSYRVGIATNLERLTAQDQLLSAQLQLTTERFTQKVSRMNLLRVTGRLSTRLPGEALAPTTQPQTRPTTMP
jgi:outer membrane protein